MRRDYGSFITPKRQRGPNLSSWALRGRDVFFWCALVAATCLLSCWRGTQTDELNRKPGIASRLRRRVASLPLRHQVLAQGKADLRRGDRLVGERALFARLPGLFLKAKEGEVKRSCCFEHRMINFTCVHRPSARSLVS